MARPLTVEQVLADGPPNDLSRHLEGAARMLGAAPVELLGACALNLWGAPTAAIYLKPSRFRQGQWVYTPSDDSLGVVRTTEADAASFLMIDRVDVYRPGSATFELMVGPSTPPPIDRTSHAKAFGFCFPGCRRSSAFAQFCLALPERLMQAGYVEVDGLWINDVDRTLLADLRSRGPTDRNSASELLRRRLQSMGDATQATAWQFLRRTLSDCAMTVLRQYGTGLLLAGDWVQLPDGAVGIVDGLPKAVGMDLVVPITVYPIGPFGPNQQETRHLRVPAAAERARAIDAFESHESPLIERRMQIQNYLEDLLSITVRPVQPEASRGVLGGIAPPAGASADPEARPTQIYEDAGKPNNHLRDFSKLKTVFLLDTGWAYRLRVTQDILDGYSATLIQGYCEYLGLPPRCDRTYESDGIALPDLVISRRKEGRRNEAWISGLGPLAKALGSAPGDHVFIGFKRDTFVVRSRCQMELEGLDSLGELLWSCGLDPEEPGLRTRPWGRVSRVLGTEGSTREDVRSALDARRDDYRLQLLGESWPDSDLMASPWPTDWRFVCARATGSTFALVHDGSARVAMGWGSAQNLTGSHKWVVSGDGIAWIELDSDSVESAEDLVRRVSAVPPAGVHVATDDWRRWVAAEHNACRLTLVEGHSWAFERVDGGWWSEGRSLGDLLEALEALPLSTRPSAQVATPDYSVPGYPRRAFDFRLAENQAVRMGIRSIAGIPERGLHSTYADARACDGLTLVQVLR